MAEMEKGIQNSYFA